uniref:Glutathione peroxidase n=1 Tax=uncultured bacterium A1Q1_fos_1815 TaxID=1256553 RepID=L7VV86_9BACT|nr:glutathione peroxidase [uncultured bacterium A1Q1_fos_1815]
MVSRLLLSGIVAMALCSVGTATEPNDSNALSFQVKSIDGEAVALSKYKGKVVVIVNVASKCGLTPQYDGLQKLYDKYKDKGLVILGFPCNQFGAQEPGSNTEIKEFCSSKYNVTFDLFDKVDVNGNGASDLYKYLTSQDTQPTGKGKISWNFEKFVVDREGKVVARYQPRTSPDDKEFLATIEKALGK